MPEQRDSRDRPPLPGAGFMEDYTSAFLVAAGVLTFMVLFAVWAVYGLAFTIALAFLVDRFLLHIAPAQPALAEQNPPGQSNRSTVREVPK